MTRQDPKNDLSLNKLRKLRAEIEERTAQVPRGDRFKTGQTIEYVKDLGDCYITETQLRYLQKQQLLRPERDESGFYLYSREDLRDLLLICELNQKLNTPYTKVAGLLLAEAKAKFAEWAESSAASGTSALQNQIERAHLFWRSHLLMALLGWLFDGTIPRFTNMLIRKQDFLIRSMGDDRLRVEICECDFRDLGDILSDGRDGDEVVTTTRDREVLPAHITWDEWKNCHKKGFRWYRLRGNIPQSSTSYQVVIGVPRDEAVRGVRTIMNRQEESFCLHLLAACFVQVREVSAQAEIFELVSTRLQIIVNLVPDLSSHWQYSAVLMPSPLEPQRLIVVASSQHFPQDVQRNAQVSRGQLLSGWAFQNNQCLVVQRTTGEEDPRLAYQTEERATAAAAIPTLAHDAPNGVLYVGTREQLNGDAFTETELQILRILGRVFGQLIELEQTHLDIGISALEITNEPVSQGEPWEGLQETIAALVDDLKHNETARQSRDNLHLMLVRVSNYDALQKHSAEIAEWAAIQIYLIAYRYYLNHELGEPLLYKRAAHEFALLLERVSMTDEEEQTLRDELRDLLTSIFLPFEQGKPPLLVECDLWSLSFRYSDLALRIDQEGAQEIIQELVQTTDRAFRRLDLIHQAHEYEERGAWDKARELYELASAIDPKSIYIWRHTAKTHTYIYDHDGAIRWWTRITKAHQHPSYSRHLAHNLACAGDLSYAKDECDEAIRLDGQNAKCYAEMGAILYLCERYDEAIENFRKAMLFDLDNRATYLLRIAEVQFTRGQYRDALSACSQARTYQPKNPDIPFWEMKICHAMRSSASGNNSGYPPKS